MKKRRRVTNPTFNHDQKFRTRQQPAEHADINGIVEKARRGIAPTWINSREPIYADMTQVPRDLLSAYQKIEAAETAFMALPAKIRTQMDNSPLNLEAWLSDPENRSEAERYGLIVKKEEPTPSPASPDPSEAGKGAKAGKNKKVSSEPQSEESDA